MKIKNGRFGSGVPDANWLLNEGTGDRMFTQHNDFGKQDPEQFTTDVQGLKKLLDELPK